MFQWTVFGKYLLLQKKKLTLNLHLSQLAAKFQMESKIEKTKTTEY